LNIMGSNTPKKNRTLETIADQTLADGLVKHAVALPTLAIAGTSVTTNSIVTTLQSRMASAKTVLSTRATWQAAVQADIALRDKTNPFVAGLKQAILVAFAGQVDVLADFGLTSRKPRVLTPDAKLAAVTKAKATRAARHTMGSKQKAAIKGAVPPATPVASAPATPDTKK
jgi:hypothetical protein